MGANKNTEGMVAKMVHASILELVLQILVQLKFKRCEILSSASKMNDNVSVGKWGNSHILWPSWHKRGLNSPFLSPPSSPLPHHN